MRIDLEEYQLSGGCTDGVPLLTDSGNQRGSGDSSGLRVDRLLGERYVGRLRKTSDRMRVILSSLTRIANSNVPVLLQGESGVGKEILARQIHAASARASKPFLKLNCTALPYELLESELFGHERGAFTGAYKSTPGMFDVSDGGTILLDEIGDMDVRLQAKLLHVLQDSEFQRVGGRRQIKVDVRLMASTNCDLQLAIRSGKFREDLYYRLNVIQIEIPPLRERRDEIPELAKYFIRKHSASVPAPVELPPRLMKALLQYDWPGNIRELENAMQRLLVLQDAEELIRELAPRSAGSEKAAPVTENALRSGAGNEFLMRAGSLFEKAERAKEELETEAILAALESTHWHRKKAAALLGVKYKALLYRIRKLGLQGDSPVNCARSGR